MTYWWIELERDTLDRIVAYRILGEVREIGEMEKAPEGRDGCEDCRRLGELVRLVQTFVRWLVSRFLRETLL